MRSLNVLGVVCLLAGLIGCSDASVFPRPAAQAILASGRRITGFGDLREPRYAAGGASYLTVTGPALNGRESVFVLNPLTLEFALASRADTILDQATGLDIEFIPDAPSTSGVPSGDGSLVSYLSRATNLLKLRWTFEFRRHAYVRDIFDESNVLVSLGASPGPGNESRILIPDPELAPEANSATSSAELSGSSRFVVFATDATNVVPVGANGLSQIYVFDRFTGVMEILTRVVGGPNRQNVFPGDGPSFAPTISSEGRFVAYQSDAGNLIEGDTPLTRDLFVFNRTERITDRVNVDNGGRLLVDPGPPRISEDGTRVVFSARFAPGSPRQIFVRDRMTQTTRILSRDHDLEPGDDDSTNPALSPDGRFAVWQSDATNLVLGDTNGLTDIFVFDLRSGLIARVNVSEDGLEADGESLTPTISPTGEGIAFVSRALNLVEPTAGDPTPPSRTLDLYIFANPLLAPGG